METVTIIQARTGSKRLPGKILQEALGKPILLLMLERVQRAKTAGRIVIATTSEKEDEKIAGLCAELGVNCFKGNTFDLLDRHYRCAKEFNADTVVKIPSDCPLIDPLIIDKVISFYNDNMDKFDFVSNLHPPSYPDGNDVEVFSFGALAESWSDAYKNYEREHTTPYIWDNPRRFRIGNVKWETGLDFSLSHRWTLDYYEDYLLIKNIFEELYEKNPQFGMNEILKLNKEKPGMFAINREHRGYYWYRNHINELKTLKQELIKN